MGATTEDVLRAVYNHSSMYENVRWNEISEYGKDDIYRLTFDEFDKAIRIADLLRTPSSIVNRWKDFCAKDLIIYPKNGARGKPLSGFFSLNKVKHCVPEFAAIIYVPDNVHTLDVFAQEKKNKKIKNTDEGVSA